MRSLPRDLPSLTSLRAVAALMVFCSHLASGYFPHNANRLGYVGVAFFFVLSGFVLTWSAGWTAPGRFLVRRFARIYPSHFAVLLLALLLPVNTHPGSLGQTALVFVLIQAWAPSLTTAYAANGVTWSLSCEMAFYLAFPAILPVLSRLRLVRVWGIALAMWATTGAFVIYASRVNPESADAAIGTVNPLAHLPEFVIGIALALTIKQGVRIPMSAAMATVLVALAGAAVFHGKPAMNVWSTLVFAMVIGGFALADVSERSPLRQRWLVYAGEISFAFYLVHQVIIDTLRGYMGDGWGMALTALTASCFAAVAVHHLVELPAHRWLTQRYAKRRGDASIGQVRHAVTSGGR